MRTKTYQEEKERQKLYHEIYRLRVVEGLEVSCIQKKLGVSRSRVYSGLSIFERDNPQEAAMMKKQGKDVTEEDYKKLLNEISSLKKDLAQERLRADFYEEMVAFGKEVYGIDLKKAGTKWHPGFTAGTRGSTALSPCAVYLV